MNALKPCPFCGSTALVFKTKHKTFPYKVMCVDKDCSCQTCRWMDYTMAIESWNRRAGEQE